MQMKLLCDADRTGIRTIIGPAFSPLVGGYVDQYLGWRWIFYLSTMIGGVILIANLLFMRETLHRPQQEDQEKNKSIRERLARLKFNPVSICVERMLAGC